MHGVYAKPFNVGVDEANLWGDYYYLEALRKIGIRIGSNGVLL